MVVDVAHASAATIDDVLAVATRPVVASHTGVRGTADNARNLSDDHLRGIAATGGVVGIGFWDTATVARTSPRSPGPSPTPPTSPASTTSGSARTSMGACRSPSMPRGSSRSPTRSWRWAGTRTPSARSWAATRCGSWRRSCPPAEPGSLLASGDQPSRAALPRSRISGDLPTRDHPDPRPERRRARRHATSTPSCRCPSAVASSTRRARSTAASTPSGTTAPSASSSRTTSSAPGGGRWSRSATTSSGWTPGSSCTRRSGSRPGTSDRSATRWSSARPTIAGSGSTSCRAPSTSPRPSSRTRRSSSGSGLRCPVDGGPLSAAAPVQPHVQDVHGSGRGGRVGHLPAPRDRPGLVRQLQERPAVVAQEAALRHRPDRQVVPQRDLARQLRLPDARVRADGDAVLRPAGGGGRRRVRGVAAASDAPGTSATA